MICRLANRRSFVHATRRFGIIAILILSVSPATHAEWRVLPAIGLGYEYDDNARLAPDTATKEDIRGYTADASATFVYTAPLTTFSLTPRLIFRRYDESEFDIDSQFLALRFQREFRRAQFRLRGTFNRQPIRLAERSNLDFDIEEPEEIAVDDSGLVFQIQDRDRIMLVPEWTQQLTQRLNLRLGLMYIDSSYESQNVALLRDFSELSFTGSLGYKLNERDTVSFAAYQRTSDFAQSNSDVEGFGVGLRFSRALSENTRLNIDAGVDTTEDENGENQTSPIGTVSLVRRFETGNLLLTYQRRVNGGGSANIIVRDLFNISGTKELSERTAVSLGLRAYTSDSIDDGVSAFEERDYLQVRLLWSRFLSRSVAVDVDYRYTFIDRQFFGSSANANQINFWLRYRPNRER